MAVALGSMKTDPATGLLGIWCYYAQCEVENYSPFLPSRAQFSLGISVVFVVRFTHTHTLAPLPSLSLPCSSPNSTTTAHKGRHGFTDFSFTCTTTAWHKCTVGSLIIAHLFPSVSPFPPSLPPSSDAVVRAAASTRNRCASLHPSPPPHHQPGLQQSRHQPRRPQLIRTFLPRGTYSHHPLVPFADACPINRLDIPIRCTERLRLSWSVRS